MFTFGVTTKALFGAGKLNELHTEINTPAGAVHGTFPMAACFFYGCGSFNARC